MSLGEDGGERLRSRSVLGRRVLGIRYGPRLTQDHRRVWPHASVHHAFVWHISVRHMPGRATDLTRFEGTRLSEKRIKVTDRRMFDADGNLREEYEELREFVKTLDEPERSQFGQFFAPRVGVTAEIVKELDALPRHMANSLYQYQLAPEPLQPAPIPIWLPTRSKLAPKED